MVPKKGSKWNGSVGMMFMLMLVLKIIISFTKNTLVNSHSGKILCSLNKKGNGLLGSLRAVKDDKLVETLIDKLGSAQKSRHKNTSHRTIKAGKPFLLPKFTRESIETRLTTIFGILLVFLLVFLTFEMRW